MVEDCHTSYWRRFGGGLRRRGSFIEYAKNVVDDVNFWHQENPPTKRSWRTDMVESVDFCSAVVTFRKRAMNKPERIDIGDLKALDLEAPFRDGALGGLIVSAKRIPLVQEAVRRNSYLWNLMKRVMGSR